MNESEALGAGRWALDSNERRLHESNQRMTGVHGLTMGRR